MENEKIVVIPANIDGLMWEAGLSLRCDGI